MLSGDIDQLVQTLSVWSAALLEFIGVTIILIFSLLALGYGIIQYYKAVEGPDIFRKTRRRLIRGIIMGLEFLVAADIIQTVAVELSFETIGVLAILVVIRTFLSFSLEVEMTGHWPWKSEPTG